MFVKRSTFDYWCKTHEENYTRLNERYWELDKKNNERYWELARRHNLLLEHLGLNEVVVPEKTILRKKGGPEHE